MPKSANDRLVHWETEVMRVRVPELPAHSLVHQDKVAFVVSIEFIHLILICDRARREGSGRVGDKSCLSIECSLSLRSL
jgi:hypothetical protein